MHYTKEQLALSPSAHKLGAHNRTAQLQRPAEGRIVRSRDGPKNCSLIDSIITCLSKAKPMTQREVKNRAHSVSGTADPRELEIGAACVSQAGRLTSPT
jgi:hypothetical protein